MKQIDKTVCYQENESSHSSLILKSLMVIPKFNSSLVYLTLVIVDLELRLKEKSISQNGFM